MKIAVDKSAVTVGDIDFSRLEELAEVVYFDGLSAEELYALAADCGGIIVNKVPVDGGLLSACPQIKYVGLFATGYNNIDLEECSARGVTVCNVPDYSTDAVAQHAFALMLSFAGEIPRYTRSVGEGDWLRSKNFCYIKWPTHEIAGATLGVVGYGNIGKKVARIGAAFGMKILIYTRTFSADCPFLQVSAEELFSSSDYISLHCPLTPQTKKIINARTISMMKKGAVIINTARGGLVDERAAADALKSGKLGGLLADVLADEPMRRDNPLYGAPNCLLTPHIAWVPQETRQRLVDIAAENLKAYLCGKPVNKVN